MQLDQLADYPLSKRGIFFVVAVYMAGQRRGLLCFLAGGAAHY
jgi:hypothetical protein